MYRGAPSFEEWKHRFEVCRCGLTANCRGKASAPRPSSSSTKLKSWQVPRDFDRAGEKTCLQHPSQAHMPAPETDRWITGNLAEASRAVEIPPFYGQSLNTVTHLQADFGTVAAPRTPQFSRWSGGHIAGDALTQGATVNRGIGSPTFSRRAASDAADL